MGVEVRVVAKVVVVVVAAAGAVVVVHSVLIALAEVNWRLSTVSC